MGQLTDARAGGRFYIESYRPGGFRIGGVDHDGSLLIAQGFIAPWIVAEAAAVDAAALAPLFAAIADLRILVLGTGPRFVLPPPALRAALKARGVVLESMDTGAACRTLNQLIGEGRPAAGALIAL